MPTHKTCSVSIKYQNESTQYKYMNIKLSLSIIWVQSPKYKNEYRAYKYIYVY